MSKLKFLDSFVFRLALTYTAFVVGAITLAFGFSYVVADQMLEKEMQKTIVSETERLQALYRASPDIRELFPVIRTRQEISQDAIYQLYHPISEARPEPEVLLGERRMRVSAPDEDGWADAFIPPIDGATARSARVLLTQLNPDVALAVGRDRSAQHRVREILLQVMLSGLGITTALGLAGGAMAAQRMVRRVERARRAAQDIITGDLKRRLPLSGFEDELERLTITLNHMLDRIERLVTAMREVTDDVAHDLRTPLTRLRARAERALQAPESSEADLRAALEECVGEADRLLAIFKAILSIARLKTQAGANAEHPEIDVSQAVADAAELYEPVLEEQGVRLRLEIPPGLRVNAERTLIGQTLANLIENALHYGMPPKDSGREPEISLALADRGDRVEICVADRGRGVPPEKREAVFARFSRLDPSRAEEGVGLGLAFVRAVAEAHGGSARIEDAKPGARVVIALPKPEPQPEAPPQRKAPSATARPRPA